MKKEIPQHAPHSAVYGLGLIGAAIYYISHAAGFWPGILGFNGIIFYRYFLPAKHLQLPVNG